MSTINKKFKTKASATEMRHFIDTKILMNPALKPMIENVNWNGDTLNFSSKLGKGYITIFDNLLEINIELNFLGSLARNTIESTIDNEMKQLNS